MKKLSINEMKKVIGGTGEDNRPEAIRRCCVHNASWSIAECANVYPSDAQAEAQAAGLLWCCKSCAF